ncbi:uncharacterized protein LOC114727545 [Neltuma alba]|uniref:uncharacterized protein LOC114727545 n=1 Tax=Neltuma alba TaxID=207710 RepID=UPI0010A58838|nr:uncharacterized protein LOC114727545 [Prosopis alba]
MATNSLIPSSKKSLLVPQSREEEDLITRSSKKIKNGDNAQGGNLLSEHWPALGEKKTRSSRGTVSFADKLKGVEPNEEDGTEEDYEEISDDSLSDKEQNQENDEPLCRMIEDPKRNFPTFVFSGRMKKRLYKAWKRAVILKLLGRSIGFKALKSRLQGMWAKRGVTKLINIGYGYYVVKFSNREDYWNALTGGPWMIFDHYLTVWPWEPKFQSNRASIDKVAVWVRLPRIFLEYYDKEALTMIGNRIGETIKIDMNTSCQLRGHYAQICVLVDLTKQLMSGFSVDGENYYLEYEGLHLLCTNCGVYGHR